jgi:hypothetical protein
MTKVVRPHFRSAAEELITKLINGGYLQPALRDDPDAITTAIVRLKEDLRGGSDDGGPRAASLRAAASQQPSFDIELAIMRSCMTADFCANSSEPIPSSTLRALAISHAPDRALGLKAAFRRRIKSQRRCQQDGPRH